MKKNISLRCKICGRTTSHYLVEETGEYHCSVCGHVNKKVAPKKKEPKKTVEFTPDFEIPASEKSADITPENVLDKTGVQLEADHTTPEVEPTDTDNIGDTIA